MHYIYNHDGVIIVTLYVDDLLVVGGDIQLIEKIWSKLMEKFKMTDMGDVSLVLGMQTTRDREKKTLTISQEEYAKSILERFDMPNCKVVGTPGFDSELSTKQPEETLVSTEETQRYQAITGSVMYLCSDIEVRHHVQLGSTHSCYVKACEGIHGRGYLLRYLAGTTDFTIVYKKGGFKLTAFSDSNWGNIYTPATASKLRVTL